MMKQIYKIKYTKRFLKDLKREHKRGRNFTLLKYVIRILAKGEILPEKNKDHPLKGEWKGYRECHISPDWLLIYKIQNDILILTLTRTGTHSDLF